MSCEIKHHRLAKMEYCYSGTERLWYGSWNHHVCRKGKFAADRHSRSAGINPSRKQRCCSPSCLWSQAQRGTSDPDNSQNLGYWLTIRHRCICMWSWTEMLIFLSSWEQGLYEFCFVWVQKCAVFRSFLLHVLTYWAEILHFAHDFVLMYYRSNLSVVNFYTPVFRRDVLWYDMVYIRLSVRPGLRPPVFRTFPLHAWHIELTFGTWLCFNDLQNTLERRKFPSIFVGSYVPFTT